MRHGISRWTTFHNQDSTTSAGPALVRLCGCSPRAADALLPDLPSAWPSSSTVIEEEQGML